MAGVVVVRMFELGPVQPNFLLHAVVALTENKYFVHAVRPVTFTDLVLVVVFTALTDEFVELSAWTV